MADDPRQPYDQLEVVVTGGTGALGKAVVERLVEAGARCHLPVFEPRELEHFTLRDHPRVRWSEPVDLASPQEVDAFFAACPPLWGSIHCAGGFAMGPIVESGSEAFQHQMALNATTCYLCCRAAVQRIRQRSGEPRGGRIVNVAARPALEPRLGGGMVAYTASKAAVAAISQSLGEELAREGIWVNAVAPSILDTPANRAAMPDADPAPWPTPREVAETIAFLASPHNGTTRSSVVPVYGAV